MVLNRKKYPKPENSDYACNKIDAITQSIKITEDYTHTDIMITDINYTVS